MEDWCLRVGIYSLVVNSIMFNPREANSNFSFSILLIVFLLVLVYGKEKEEDLNLKLKVLLKEIKNLNKKGFVRVNVKVSDCKSVLTLEDAS